jgi:hypothetical protein
LRLPQIFRLLHRLLLRGRLPARHPPLLQSQHQKPLPICLHPGRAGRDHKGWCRPRGPALTRQSHRAQIGSMSLSLRPSTGPNRQRQRTQRTVSLNSSSASALRAASLREAGFAPEGLAAVGLENSLAGPVRADLVETVEKPDRVGYGSPPGLRMVYRPSDLLPGSAHLGRGRPDVHPCRRGVPALAFSFTMTPGTDDPFGPCGWEHRFGHGTRRT